MKIRKLDKVEIISWKSIYKWTRWEVEKVLPLKNKIIVKWVNIVTRHFKKSWTKPWEIKKFEKPVDASTVMLVCPFTDKTTRIWYVLVTEKWVQKKYRFSKMALKLKWWVSSDYIIK